MNEVSDFACPNCKSRYKIVRVRLNPNFPSRLLHCRVCKEPLTPTDGKYALKHFLVEATNRNGFDLQMKHRAPQGQGARWRLIGSMRLSRDRDGSVREELAAGVIKDQAPMAFEGAQYTSKGG